MDEGGDAQARLALEPALLGPQPGGALGRLDRAGAVDPGVVAQPVRGDLASGVGVTLVRPTISPCMGATVPFWSSQ